MHQPGELAHVNLYEWVKCYKREKLHKKEKHCCLPVDKDRAVSADGSRDISLSLDQSLDIVSEHDDEHDDEHKPEESNTKKN